MSAYLSPKMGEMYKSRRFVPTRLVWWLLRYFMILEKRGIVHWLLMRRVL